MANNRAFLICTECPDSKPLYLWKYFPSRGRYTNRSAYLHMKSQEQWFEEHMHYTLFGDYIKLVFEGEEHE